MDKLKTSKDATVIEGTIGHHTITNEEKVGFIDYINGTLCHDKDLKERGLPLNKEDDSLFKACSDGILLWYELKYFTFFFYNNKIFFYYLK